jgi:hypothetical protein
MVRRFRRRERAWGVGDEHHGYRQPVAGAGRVQPGGRWGTTRAGLEAGVIEAALVMAVGCGWGLTRCLAEYR